MKVVRHCPTYLIAMLLAFLAGLMTHFTAKHLPHFIGQNMPDTLWALWVYLSLVWLAPRLPLLRAIGYALSFSYVIEASQIYHAPWIDGIRATLLGKLILGDTFSWSDLGCYTVGIAGGAVLDYKFQTWNTARLERGAIKNKPAASHESGSGC